MDNQGSFAISTAHRLASEVGRDLLRSGGNAFDAAVAAAVTLGVVEPGNSGVGGEGYCIFYDANTGTAGSLCFMGEPCALAFPENVHGKELFRGILAPIVPGAVAGWFALISRKCTRLAEELFRPAIDFARAGFNISSDEANSLNWMADQFHPSAHNIFCRGDRPWEAGDRLYQFDLACTLEGLAKGGIDHFYTGKIAESFDRFFSESGGLLRAEDLAAYRVRWQGTLVAQFNSIQIHVPPPESMGFSVLFGLKLLEAVGIQDMNRDRPEFISTILNVLKQMDSCFAEISGKYLPYDHDVLERVDNLLRKDHIQKTADALMEEKDSALNSRTNSHTTSLAVADGYGNLVCLTQTLDDGYGSGVVVPGTGILLNNGMAWIETDPEKDSVDLVGPRKHVFVPVVPTISLTASGNPLLALGTPGGYGIPQTTVQVLAYFLFSGDSVRAAIDRPRVGVGAFSSGYCHDSGLKLEEGFSQELS